MKYQETTKAIAGYQQEILALRQKVRALQQAIAPQPVKDYTFQSGDGEVQLSSLFGDKRDLFVIHNMGASCSYCTLWADGLNGVLPHLQNRAAFVLSSPDSPEQQRKFAESRDWRFRMLSHQGSSFAEDMGYRAEGGWMPGVSVFAKRNGEVVRVSDTPFGPGDDFCAVWHLLDLMPEGPDGWEPQYSY